MIRNSSVTQHIVNTSVDQVFVSVVQQAIQTMDQSTQQQINSVVQTGSTASSIVMMIGAVIVIVCLFKVGGEVVKKAPPVV